MTRAALLIIAMGFGAMTLIAAEKLQSDLVDARMKW